MTAIDHVGVPQIPDGVWTVDPEQSEIRFAVKAMWGMSTVRGGFSACAGEMTMREGSASGELAVDARSINTGNARRDRHLRSADFFDAERHPWIRFRAGAMVAGEQGAMVRGALRVRAAETRLELPLRIERTGEDGWRLRGEATI